MNQITRDTFEWLNAVKKPIESEQELLAFVDTVESWIAEELNEFRVGIKSRAEKLNAVVDAHWILDNLSHAAGLTIHEIDTEAKLVRDSNFSKFCATHDEAVESVLAYGNGTHPNKMGENIQAYFKATGNENYPYVILKTKDDKILKSINFVDVDQINQTGNEGKH